MSDDDLRQQLLAAFAIEHQEHLSAIRRILASASDGGTSGPAASDVTQIFRRAHSLKGAARAVDLPGVEAIAHRLEGIFAKLQRGELGFDRQTIATIHYALDAIEDHVANPDRRETPESAAKIFATLDGMLGAAAPPPATPAEAAPAAAGETTAAEDRITINTGHIQQLSSAVHEIAAEAQRQATLEQALRRVGAQFRALQADWRLFQHEAGAPAGVRLTARVEAIDRAMPVLDREIRQLTRAQDETTRAFQRITSVLREDTERLFLISAQQVFGGFERMVRGLARELGKEVDVYTHGLDTEIDRRILQALKDPVMHMLRNAIAHGIEPPATRRARGKPANGTVRLELAPQGSFLSLRVSDDGGGLDLPRIAERAVALGRLPAGGIAPSPRRLAQFLLQPGFSTADTVDHVSGRGMGLAVLDEAVRALNGTVEIEPGAENGTVVAVLVPLTLARQTVVLVEAAGQTYAFRSGDIDRLVLLPASALVSLEGRLHALIDEEALPLAGLAGLLGVDQATVATSAGRIGGVILRGGAAGRCLVAVDAFVAVETNLIEAPDASADRRLIAGCTTLDNGNPAFVLDGPGIAEAVTGQALRGTTTFATEAVSTKTQQTILVVDDSLTTRTLEKQILEAQGYRVLLSVDGMEALAKLREEPVDLVIADVEMPRLDGFGLVQAMKNDQHLAGLPVILVTSRAEAEDIRRGLELGADAYLVKQKFDQRELLATIGQLL